MPGGRRRDGGIPESKVLLDFEARVVVVGENICDKIYEIVKKK